jgi:hypothetical protein
MEAHMLTFKGLVLVALVAPGLCGSAAHAQGLTIRRPTPYFDPINPSGLHSINPPVDYRAGDAAAESQRQADIRAQRQLDEYYARQRELELLRQERQRDLNIWLQRR